MNLWKVVILKMRVRLWNFYCSPIKVPMRSIFGICGRKNMRTSGMRGVGTMISSEWRFVCTCAVGPLRVSAGSGNSVRCEDNIHESTRPPLVALFYLTWPLCTPPLVLLLEMKDLLSVPTCTQNNSLSFWDAYETIESQRITHRDTDTADLIVG